MCHAQINRCRHCEQYRPEIIEYWRRAIAAESCFSGMEWNHDYFVNEYKVCIQTIQKEIQVTSLNQWDLKKPVVEEGTEKEKGRQLSPSMSILLSLRYPISNIQATLNIKYTAL